MGAQCHVMPAINAAGAGAYGTCPYAAGDMEELVEIELDCGNRVKPAPEPLPVRLVERSKLIPEFLQQCGPIVRFDLLLSGHSRTQSRKDAVLANKEAAPAYPGTAGSCCVKQDIEVVGENRKPGSVPYCSYPRQGGDHSSRTTVADGLKRPDPGASNGPSSNTPLFGLAPDGVYQAADVTAGTGELLPHPFTLTTPRPSRGGRSTLCGTFPGVAPGPR